MTFAWSAPPRVIGHRGAPREAVENTLASFEAAQRAGVTAVELDARLSADGRVVVHHDAVLGRVIAGEGAIEETRAEALQAHGIPLLREVLALPLLVNVEIKADAANAAEIPARVLADARAMGALDRVLVTSFDPELADAYARLADRPAGAILPFPPGEDDIMAFPRLTFYAIADDAAIPEAFDLCAKAQRHVLVWTVNDERRAMALLAMGASSVFTDRPGPLRRALEGVPDA